MDPNVATPGFLCNGLIGIRFGSESKLFDIANYESYGEEKVKGANGFFDDRVFVGDDLLNPSVGTEYSSQLDMRTGVVGETWLQETRAGGQTSVNIQTVVHPSSRAMSQRWTIQPSEQSNLKVTSNLGNEIIDATDGNGTSISQTQNEIVRAGVKWSLTELVKSRPFSAQIDGNSNRKAVPANCFILERTISERKGTELDFAKIAKSAMEASRKAWQSDIQIDGPVEDQQFVRSAIFYLRSSIHPEGKMSVSPMGLSSDIYGGHVFWDADIWVFPALALIDPERAKAIPDYRLRRSYEYPGGFNKAPVYGRNMREWLAQGRPIGNGKLGKPTEPLLHEGSELKVPWESSVTGKETVPGPSRFQDHITGSVHFMLRQADALGLVEPSHVTRFTWGATDFYFQRITKRPDGKYDLKGTMSPDENHIGDNDLYTNLVAQSVLDDGLWKMPKTQIPRLHLPKDDTTFLTYDNDALRGYKQAAAVLSIYPLQYPPAEAQAKAMMERFADKVTKNGPAMSDSVHALIWARLGEKDRAYRAWHNSWKPFVKPPFLLFSEKRSSSRTYFTTGAAGSLNAVLYGFAGIRIDDKKAPGAQWSMPLKNGKVLSIAPNLPKEWRKLTLKNLTILGKKYTFEIEADRVKVM